MNVFTNIKMETTTPLELTSGNQGLEQTESKQSEELELFTDAKKPELFSQQAGPTQNYDVKNGNKTEKREDPCRRATCSKNVQTQAAENRDIAHVGLSKDDIVKEVISPEQTRTSPGDSHDKNISRNIDCPKPISSNADLHMELNQASGSGVKHKPMTKGTKLEQELARKSIRIKLLESNAEALKKDVGLLMLEKEESDAEKEKLILDIRHYSAVVASPVKTRSAKLSEVNIINKIYKGFFFFFTICYLREMLMQKNNFLSTYSIISLAIPFPEVNYWAEIHQTLFYLLSLFFIGVLPI